MPVVFDPKYILRLDDLPKIVEADGTVYPVFMTLRDAARLFATTPESILRWNKVHGLPVLRVGGSVVDGRGSRIYIEVAVLNDWIRAHSQPRRDYRRDEVWGDNTRRSHEEG